MQERERFKEALYNLSIEELQEKAQILSSQLIKAKNRVNSNGESAEEIEYKLNAIKNRITALKIRC